jgi:hypothetical protein
MAEEKLVTIRTYSYHNESLIDKVKLESAGIPCILMDENTILVQPFYSNAIGGIKLQVNESDVDQALQILADNPENENVTDVEELQYIQEQQEIESRNAKSYKWGCVSMILFLIVALAYIFFRSFKF